MIHKKKIFFWSPLLSHVGTIKAAEKSALSLKKYLHHEIFLINVFGEFDHLKHDKHFIILNIFNFRKWPKTGFLSKLVIYTFTILSIFKLINYYRKYKPDVIISNLVGYLPNALKYFFPNLVVINSIQGLPKFNLVRKILWNIFYIKADHILTMTEKTKRNIFENKKFKNNISKIDNPVINKKIRELSFKKIDIQDNKFFDVITFCAVGRLTRQKNFKEIIEAVNLIPIKFHSKFRIIIGKGEEYDKLNKLIKLYNLKNVFLVGFKKTLFHTSKIPIILFLLLYGKSPVMQY